MAALLKIEHLEVRYGDLIGVADVSLEVPKGSVVALLGSNGAGKTTTLNAIAGIVPVAKGTVSFDGASIGGVPAHAIVRKGIALSPEGWRLFTQQSVENNLLLGATPLPDRTRIPRLLERVYSVFPRLAERRHQRAGTMSGGERQMLAVGRALMGNPALLLMDEPLEGLAPVIVDALLAGLGRLKREAGLSLLLVEQHAHLALEFAEDAIVLDRGRVVFSGLSEELLGAPERLDALMGVGSRQHEPSPSMGEGYVVKRHHPTTAIRNPS
jgi:branched-chain amino acid transport system ATP-binding protein